MFSLLVTFRTITIKNDFCYVQTIGITYTYNRVILSSDSALKFAIYLKGGIFVLCFFHKY